MGIEALFKLVTGMLKAKGISLVYGKIEITPDAFNRIGQAALLHGAEMIRIEGSTRDGACMVGLMVTLPAGSSPPWLEENRGDNARMQLAEIST